MKVFSQYKKLIPFIIGSFTILGLSSCNLMGFMDKPSGDVQLLEAGRACLDKGDFTCARDYYQALSNSYADVKISESSLATLGENNIFFMADLFSALGSGTGSSNSLIALAETLSARGKTDANTRTTIQTLYANEAAISDSTLKAYSQLISSLTMFSTVLASAVGTDGKLTLNDIASNGSGCKARTTGTCDNTDCDIGTGTGLTSTTETGIAMGVSTSWSAAASLDKLTAAASAINNASSVLTGSGSSGIFATLNTLSGLGVLNARCQRNLLLNALFP